MVVLDLIRTALEFTVLAGLLYNGESGFLAWLIVTVD